MMHKILPLLALGSAFFPTAGDAAIVYREVFGNSGTGTASLTDYGWTTYGDGNATLPDPGNFGEAGVSANIGHQGPGNLGQTQTAPSTTNGFAFFNGNLNPVLSYTNEYNGSIPLNITTLQSVSFYQTVSGGAQVFRVALQIDGGWYASTGLGPTVGTGTNFNTAGEQRSITDFTSDNWLAINFTPGSVLSLGAGGQTLPAGDVQNFGIYIENKDGVISRVDTFEIDAIPEPASTALFALAGLLAGTRRRR